MPRPELRLISVMPSKPSRNSAARFVTGSLFYLGSSLVSAIIFASSLAKLAVMIVLILSEIVGLYRAKDPDLETQLWGGILK